SRFFTKNIYIPLGGNRKGAIITCRNLFLVFFLSGIWHGAGWNYLLWGVMHGGLYIVTRLLLDRKKKEQSEESRGIFLRVLGRIVTFSYVSIAWVYFRAPGVAQANRLLRNMIEKSWQLPGEGFLEGFQQQEFWYPMKVLKLTNLPYAQLYLPVTYLVIGLCMVFFMKNVEERKKSFVPRLGNAVSSALLFLWCIVSLSGVSTFLYFNF
ncbi:MAG: MBOAT family protein, partial [Lachnospiraceae bacterium]|nr:MBOAT family protein [Lachnospiraceae bacterium]